MLDYLLPRRRRSASAPGFYRILVHGLDQVPTLFGGRQSCCQEGLNFSLDTSVAAARDVSNTTGNDSSA
jgi:hypothetical protein